MIFRKPDTFPRTKYVLLPLLALFLGFSQAPAQTKGFEIIPYASYQFGGKATAIQGDINIKDSEAFGLYLDIDMPMRPGAQLELAWTHQNSRLDIRRFATGIRETLFNMTTDYFQIGVLYGMPKGNMVPFGLVAFGATMFNPKDVKLSTEWRFSATLGLGVKIFLSERIGIRVDGRLLMPFQWGGGGLWCGTGGCSIGLGATSAILQGNVGGGLILRL